MTNEERKALIKETAISISLCASNHPERKAEAALETIEKFYDLTKKGNNGKA